MKRSIDEENMRHMKIMESTWEKYRKEMDCETRRHNILTADIYGAHRERISACESLFWEMSEKAAAAVKAENEEKSRPDKEVKGTSSVSGRGSGDSEPIVREGAENSVLVVSDGEEGGGGSYRKGKGGSQVEDVMKERNRQIRMARRTKRKAQLEEVYAEEALLAGNGGDENKKGKTWSGMCEKMKGRMAWVVETRIRERLREGREPFVRGGSTGWTEYQCWLHGLVEEINLMAKDHGWKGPDEDKDDQRKISGENA